MASLEECIQIAAKAHAGQKDKGGEPYILHPLRVMLKMERESYRKVAILHDVIEDCPDYEFTARNALSEEECKALLALTRQPQESYGAFIERVSINEIATHVKIADIDDNLKLDRIHNLENDGFKSVGKYLVARLALCKARLFFESL